MLAALPARSVASTRRVYSPALRGTLQATERVPRPTTPAATESTVRPLGAVTRTVVREIFDSEKRSVVVVAPRTRVVRSPISGGSVR